MRRKHEQLWNCDMNTNNYWGVCLNNDIINFICFLTKDKTTDHRVDIEHRELDILDQYTPAINSITLAGYLEVILIRYWITLLCYVTAINICSPSIISQTYLIQIGYFHVLPDNYTITCNIKSKSQLTEIIVWYHNLCILWCALNLQQKKKVLKTTTTL
jgi:hypothetical protein